MRVNKSFDKGYKFILLASIIVCAIIAFSATLISVTDSSAIKNYAFAATYIDSVTPSEEGSVTLGSASLINGDTGRSLTASDFGFPGTNASATSWSYTETLKKVVPAKNNFSAYRQDGSKKKTFFINGTTGKFQFGSESYYDDVNNYMVINLDLGKAGSFLNNLLTNSMYKISVKVSATITAYCQNAATLDNEMYTYLGAKVSDGGLTASEVSDSEWSSTYAYVKDGTKTVDASVTLNNISKSVLSITSRGFYDKEWWSTGNVTYTSTVENISVVITISRDTSYTYSSSTSKLDGGDPIVATTLNSLSNAFVDGQKDGTLPSGSGYAPYITSADTSTGWSMYDVDLKSTLSKNLDSIIDGSGILQSYRNTKLGDINGHAYYKYSQVEYVDTYNYLFNKKTLPQLIDGVEDESGSLASINKYAGAGGKYPNSINKNGVISWGTGNEHFASGIKSVTVGETLIDVSAGSAAAAIYVNGVEVGYANVYKIDNARVVVQIYAYRNEKITTIVSDYGSGNCSTTITFAGIDIEKPYETATPSFESEDDVIAYGADTIDKWVRTSSLSLIVEENFYTVDGSNVDEGSPYVWFYTVKKSNSSAKDIPAVQTFSSYADMAAIGLRPISVSEFKSFVYNFEDGTAQGITTGSRISGKGVKDTSEVTGSGYYRFTFYVCDLAGNLISGSPVSFYVKVDYETPYSTTTLTTNNSVSITNANNGVWANCAETLKIDLLKNNISGNTLVFETGDATCALVFDSSKIISLNGTAVNTNQKAITIMGTLNSAVITISHSSNGKGGTIITISIPSQAVFAWDATFIMYAGLNIDEYSNSGPNIEEVSFDKVSFVKDSTTYGGINFNSPIKVYIDNTSPVIPTAFDYESKGYLKKVANKELLTLNIKEARTWFTQANMKMDSTLVFDDPIIDTDFAQGLKVYYGVKTITSASSFTSVKNFIDAYKNKSLSFDADTYKSYFDRTQIYLGSGLTSGDSDISIDFIQNAGSNMRVLVLWAVDQAGNRASDVSIYYVLADPTIYKVNVANVDNAIVGNVAKFELLNEDDVSTTTFSRGSTITLSYEFNDGYVPYQTLLVGSTTSLLLSNYTSKILWNIENDYTSLIKQGTTDENAITMQYLFDDPTKFSGLDTTLTFKVAQRKVVGYTITNTSVRYTGLPTIVPTIYTDSKSEESFVYTFRKKGSTVNETSTPIVPGDYEVQVAIPIDNASFVLDNVQIVYNNTTSAYEQRVAFVPYTITKGIVTVKATATSSYYGEYPELDSTAKGIDSAVYATLTKKGSLKLNVEGVNPSSYNILKVGSYAIVEDVPFEIENCIVTFESNYHEILQKIIQVEIDNNDKQYGESDGEYKFWVNVTDSGLNVTDMTTLLNCDESLGTRTEGEKHYYQFKSSSYIARESGESVGAYKYINNPSAFVLSNPNYAVSIVKMGLFTINKKVITIDATRQSYVFESVAEAENVSNLQGLKINYSLGKYSQYATQVSDLFNDNKLTLGLDLTNMAAVIDAKIDASAENYQYKYVYNLKLTVDSNASENFTFELSSNPTTMDIYAATPNTIIVKLKDTVKIELVYGQAFSSILPLLKYDATTHDNFEVSGNGAVYQTNFNSIDWTAIIDYSSSEYSYPNASTFAGYLNVGTYNIICLNPIMKMNGDAADGITGTYTVVVVPFPIYVVPAVVEIEPFVEIGKESKTYSKPDSDYGIGIKIKAINGKSVATYAGIYAGIGITGITDTINGSFVRAIYDENDNFVAFGSKNDSASDKKGKVLGGTNYYSYAVYQEFSSANIYGNYVINATIDKTNRLVINPYTITISVNDFKGISKVYDGTDDVVYGTNNKAVDIALKLAVPTDEVNVLFIAKYLSLGDDAKAAEKGRKSIKFSSIVLDGAQSANYTLVINAASGDSIDLSEGFKIDYLAYKEGSYSQSDWILIKDGEINILRSDFTIQKEYDNLSTLTINDVKIINRTDDYGRGTAMLYGAKANMQITYGQFPDKEVSKNYAINLELFFPLGMDVAGKIVSTDTTITVESIQNNGVWGVRVYLPNIGAEITKRNLDYSDFESVTANNRDYNATSAITFSYKLKQSAVAAGDEALLKDQYITINGATKTGEVNVGTYDTVFSSYKIDNSAFNAHYSVDIASLNSNFIGSKKIEVNIDYAKLLPRVDFISREYSGSTDAKISFVDRYNSLDSSSTMLKTLNYTEELIDELKRFTYTMTNPLAPYIYSLNGVANGDVQVDKDGNVLLHNVLVTGLTITEIGSANYLKNYVVYGGRYNTFTKAYDEVGAVDSGLLIADYEMFNVAGLTKKNLTIFGNDIDVDNKVYDGTKNASINVKLDGSDAVEADKEYLAVIATATYARKQVGENINVTIRVSQLVLKDANDEAHKNLLNNYQLTAFTQKMQRNILARPVGFTVSIKNRIYNGSEAITKDLIKYDLSQMINDDAKNYSVNTEKGAYYLNKDVNLRYYTKLDAEKDEFDSSVEYYIYDSVQDKYILDKTVTEKDFETKCASGLYVYEITILDKEATAYNPILNNSKEKYINYTLSVVVDITAQDLPAKGTFFAYQDKKGNVYYGTDCLIVTKAGDTYNADRKYYQYSTTTGYSRKTLDASTFGAGYYYIDENVQYLYYPLNSSDKYITVVDYNALSEANKQIADKSIVGFYIYNNQNVYILDSNIDGIVYQTMTYEVKYVQGLGKVTQRQVAVTSVSILKNENFTKYYDGTTKFYGEKDVDYEFNSSAIANDIVSDHLTVENVTAKFKAKNAGLTQVEFTATGIATEKGYTDYSFNYSSKSSSSTNKTATILKRTIYAYLDDATMIYGTALSNVNVNIKYYLDPACKAENEIKVVDGKWLVKFDSFCNVCGIDFATLEDKYQEELKSKRYSLDSNKYVVDVNGDYYMINDISYDTKGNIATNNITAPVKDIIVSGTKQNVGYIAERFGLKGGSATNFEFKYVYTKNDKKGIYSKLEVVKKTLYVVAEYREYSREYGKDLAANAVRVNLLNEQYKDGIISGETSQDVYKGTLTVEFRKVSIADIANIASASAVTSISLINASTGNNEGLPEGYYYVAYIVKSEDFASQNYDLKFGSIYYDSAEKKFKYSFAGTEFSTQVPELEIVLPSITGVSLASEELEVAYNKKEQASSLVKGLADGDEVKIDDNVGKDVKIDSQTGEVCAYSGEVIVTRKLIANENGISYVITKSLGNAKLTIAKASAGLYANKQTVEYDKQDHEVSKVYYGVTDTGSLASDSSYEIIYKDSNGNIIDKNTSSLTEAGTYTYIVKFTSQNTNYKDEEKSSEFVITPAKINVVLSAETRLTQEYVPGTKYSIKYSIEDEMGIGISLANTELIFLKNGKEVEGGIFNEAGRYQYQILLSKDKQNEFGSNIQMNNNIGFLDLTISQIVSYDSDSKQVAQLELKNQGDSLLVDKFSTRYVSSANDLAEDDAYWASINQYMAAIEKRIGAGATLTSIVRMTLTYGLNTQSLSSKDAIVSVSLPGNVDSSLDGYVVYQTTANGTLVEVKPSDYTLNNGTITYSTNYLGSLVFVKLGDPGLSTGAKVAIGVCVPAFVLTVLGLVAVTLIKKKKLKVGL